MDTLALLNDARHEIDAYLDDEDFDHLDTATSRIGQAIQEIGKVLSALGGIADDIQLRSLIQAYQEDGDDASAVALCEHLEQPGGRGRTGGCSEGVAAPPYPTSGMPFCRIDGGGAIPERMAELLEWALECLGAAIKLASLDAEAHRSPNGFDDLHPLPRLSLQQLRIHDNDLAWLKEMPGQDAPFCLILEGRHGQCHSVGETAFLLHRPS